MIVTRDFMLNTCALRFRLFLMCYSVVCAVILVLFNISKEREGRRKRVWKGVDRLLFMEINMCYCSVVEVVIYRFYDISISLQMRCGARSQSMQWKLNYYVECPNKCNTDTHSLFPKCQNAEMFMVTASARQFVSTSCCVGYQLCICTHILSSLLIGSIFHRASFEWTISGKVPLENVGCLSGKPNQILCAGHIQRYAKSPDQIYNRTKCFRNH